VWHWKTKLARVASAAVFRRTRGHSVIPGVVFSGTTNGMMRGVFHSGGKVLWKPNTGAGFSDRERRPAKGGGRSTVLPVIVGG